MRTRLLHAVQSLQRGLDVLADYLGAEPQRPKVGPWIETGNNCASVFDDHGAPVACAWMSTDTWRWWALRAYLPTENGEAEPSREAARDKAVAVLSTWADCSAIQGREAGE
jgi:hypothetical protein